MKVLDVLSTVGALVMAATPLAVAGVAHAQPVTPVSIQVGDLDFGNRADIARFDSRVTRVAETLCADNRDLTQQAACVSAVHDEAVDQLGSAQRSQMIASAKTTSSWSVASAQ